MSVQIKVVETKKDFKTFARFANKLYKGKTFIQP